LLLPNVCRPDHLLAYGCILMAAFKYREHA